MNNKTESLYRGQSFTHLIRLGCEEVYKAHIAMLEKSLTEYTKEGNYNQGKKIQEAINHWNGMIIQAKETK